MKDPGEYKIDDFFRTFAIVILVASLILAGRNTPANNDKPTIKTPVPSTKSHHLQTGNA
jgi:hypothetical protein